MKDKYTKEQLLEKIYKKYPSLRCFPTSWSAGTYYRQVNKPAIIKIAKELKVISLKELKELTKNKTIREIENYNNK
jgi:hypothetical protein